MLFVRDNGTVDFRSPSSVQECLVTRCQRVNVSTLGGSHAFLLLIHISGVVGKEIIIVVLYRMTEWVDDGHGTGTSDR